jgi:hypothetical protein
VLRSTAAGLAAGLVALVLAPGVLAATFGTPGVVTEADAPFVQVVGGQQYQWDITAQYDAVARVTTIFASYSTSRPIRCAGATSEIDTFWGNGGAAGTFVVAPKLIGAVAAARVTGIESTFNECTGAESDRTKTFTVGFALLGSSPISTSVVQQACVDYGPPLGVLDVTETTTARDAVGQAFVNGKAFTSRGGDILHQVTIGVTDPTCPPSQF